MTQSTPEQFIHWFKTTLKEEAGVSYSPDWKKDVERTRDLLVDFGEPELKKMAVHLIKTPDEFTKSKTGVSIQRLFAKRNQLAQAMVKPFITKKLYSGDGPQLTLEQVDWRLRYIEDLLDKPSMQADFCPKRDDFLRLHDEYTRMRPAAEAVSIAQRKKWGVEEEPPSHQAPAQTPEEVSVVVDLLSSKMTG